MQFIPLTSRYVAIVDDEDHRLLSKMEWRAIIHPQSKTVYAATSAKIGGKWVNLTMHRLLMAARPGEQIDHKNRCGIDNRKENLRRCTGQQNACNIAATTRADKTSKYKGVSHEPKSENLKKWRARIKVNKKNKHIGWFATEAEAARAYNEAARRIQGEFAYQNEVEG